MNFLSVRFLPLLLAVALVVAVPLRADIPHDLGFTAFSGTVVDTNALAGGLVMQVRGPLLDFQRGITAQSLYVIDAAPAAVAQKLVTWLPSSHAELKVWLHHPLPAKPTAADFSALASITDNSSVDYLINATSDLNPESPVLQLDKTEAQQITAMKAATSDKKALFAQFWSQVLAGRVNGFLSAQLAAQKYTVSGGDIPVMSDITSLIRADPRVYRDFHPLFMSTPLYASTKLAPASLYFECFDVEGYGALGTGAVYQAMSGPAIQSADIEYFCNSGVYCTIELEKIWPITINGKTESLVWRNDLVSTANVAYLHGMERLASSMLMLQDVKQGVDAFRAEFK